MDKNYKYKLENSFSLEELANELNSLSIKKRDFNIICSAFILKNDLKISSKDATEKVRKLRVDLGWNNDYDNIAGRIDQDCKYFPVPVFYKGIKDFVNAVRENKLLLDYEHSIKSNPEAGRAIKELSVLLKKYVFKAYDDGENNNSESNYTWVKTHLELVLYLKDSKSKQNELIDLLKSVGCDIFNDKDSKETTIDLEVIDPFTFFCYIYKYGEVRRLEILQRIATKLNIHYPEDELGIPSANAQKVWMFPWKYLRINGEIDTLWKLFYEVIDHEVLETTFQNALKIRNVGKTKLTEALFYVDPEYYFPINGPTKPYLQTVFGISTNFNSYSEYVDILKQLKQKTDKPFYQLSYEAWLWGNQTIEEPLSSYKTEKQLILPTNQILYGPPGTGKTFYLKDQLFDKYTSYNDIKNYSFVTFHQSFSYEDFIEGIKPIMPENEAVAEDLGYKIEDGVFKEICKEASGDPDNRYAIFIDEINRGNVSAIFGELITLIEVDKRTGAKNELRIKLPYSKKEFSVPPNLDIYGTMNTADRSVEALDTALRRRFEFKEMMPDYTIIEGEEVAGVLLSKVLKTINERIELLIDRDHTIGHSYFVDVDTEDLLANAFNNKIVPLLQEYFYGDYGKIGLVLGKGFVEEKENKTIRFADFKYENSEDFKTPTFILKQVDANAIIDAVHVLLGEKEVQEA